MNANGDDEEIQCRICANYVGDKNERINIFEENARRNFLQTKIRKYLYVLVSSEDRLPKMVCGNCVKRLDGIHRFATMAHRAQERLKSQFYCNSGDDVKQDNDDFYGDSKNNYKGLLRTILSNKDAADTSEIPSSPDSSVEPHGFRDSEETPSITEEMEVKVDPMIFLQCGLECSASPEVSDNDSDCDEKTLHIKESSRNEEIRLKNSGSPTRASEDENPSNDSHQKSYNCTICTRIFSTQLALQNHLWFHLPKADANCEDEKTVDGGNSRDNTDNGVLLISQDSDNSDNGFGGSNSCFVCPICNKRISTKGNLKVHLETHRPKGKYGCDICGRIFKTQSNLFRHKEYHGGVQFPCSVCGRVYPTNSTLRAHSITHSDLRPHACPLCDKTFKRNQDLKFHINQHTGARPYQCPYCPKAFASSGNCFSHRKRMHPREVNRDRQRAADLMSVHSRKRVGLQEIRKRPALKGINPFRLSLFSAPSPMNYQTPSNAP